MIQKPPDLDASFTTTNPNIIWAEIFVDELAKCGLDAVCIAPGSRSTPLTLAFDAHPMIQVYRHLDERSAAFFALGLALAQDSPVAIVCTSGTATANFYPAIIEAYQTRVPLLVLTADRPPELRHSGANQTIDQIKMYGDHVLWSVDAALPHPDAPQVVLRNLKTLGARAFATANGLRKGPIHLNFPFRKPLEPTVDEVEAWKTKSVNRLSQVTKLLPPFVNFSQGLLVPSDEQLQVLGEIFGTYERGLIICGPRCPGSNFPEAVSALSRLSHYPILADPLSGVRYGPHVQDTAVIGGYDTFLMGDGSGYGEPEVIIRFGDVPTSKRLNDYLEKINPAHRLHISSDGVWADDSHRVNQFLQADPVMICRKLATRLNMRQATDWEYQIQAAEFSCWLAMDEALEKKFFDGVIIADLVQNLPPGVRLFSGNSLAVRHLDQFGRPTTNQVQVFANRGASGIDGNISTALGIGVKSDSPLVAVMGDVTFYHDMNGLLAIKNLGLKNVTLVLLNNGGGGIFHRLPVANIEPPFRELFLTPHGLDFKWAAKMYGLNFISVNGRDAFYNAFTASVQDDIPRIIEVKTDSFQDHARRKELVAFVNGRISGKLNH